MKKRLRIGVKVLGFWTVTFKAMDATYAEYVAATAAAKAIGIEDGKVVGSATMFVTWG